MSRLPGTPSCAGTRADGTQCTKPAAPGSRYCRVHDPLRHEEAQPTAPTRPGRRSGVRFDPYRSHDNH